MPRVERNVTQVQPGYRLVELRGVRAVTATRDNMRFELTDGGTVDYPPDATLTVEIDPPGTPEELEARTKDELLEMAREMGVEVRASDTKGTIIKALCD